ncbi:MAG TPA: hypothetical protein VH720_08820 [Candidatus Limnocylindrales bacterium]
MAGGRVIAGRRGILDRRVRVLAAGALAIVVLGMPAAAQDVRAATPKLTLVTAAHYEVQPTQGRVRVTLDITATNRLRDTVTRRFYFDRAYLAVLPNTRAFRITSDVGTPGVRVYRKSRDQTLLLITFGRRLGAGRSATFRLQFDLPDPGGAPTRNVRIGPSLVSFPVWAFASNETPGSRVTVAFPPGFTVRVETGDLGEPATDAAGRTTLSSGTIRTPLRFYAFVVGDRPGSYAISDRTVRIGSSTAELSIRSWPEDAAWTTRVGGLFAQALPAIAELTGLDWTRTEPLLVQEAVSRSAGGYAGLFDPADGRVEVAYYASPFVVLHEAAHAWFNGSLLADRWANEGFASHYAVAAGERLRVAAGGTPLTPALQAAKIPLNAWAAAGRDPSATEDYGYAASQRLASLIAERAGEDGLRAVWQAAVARRAPYDADATLDEAPDWRVLLDLLEEETGKPFDDLWAAWVVRPDEAALLTERRIALDDYRATEDRAGDWTLPRPIREALRAWQFDQARALLADARVVIARQDEVHEAARQAGLRAPDTVERLFETTGFAAAASEADAELRTVAAFVDAVRARPPTPDGFQQLGLIGVRPEASIAEASAAFERGDLVEAIRRAAEARSIWDAAAGVGRDRLLSALGLAVLGLLTMAWIAYRVRWFRRRRRRGRLARSPMAHRL